MKKILLYTCIVLFVSCKKESFLSELDFTTNQIVSENNRYAVIIDPYVSLLDKPETNSVIISHARRGDVFEVKGTKIINTTKIIEHWYDLGEGWVISDTISLYSNKEKALKVSLSLITTD